MLINGLAIWLIILLMALGKKKVFVRQEWHRVGEQGHGIRVKSMEMTFRGCLSGAKLTAIRNYLFDY